jgi:tetratricopeptide (TPR) repeat protein
VITVKRKHRPVVLFGAVTILVGTTSAAAVPAWPPTESLSRSPVVPVADDPALDLAKKVRARLRAGRPDEAIALSRRALDAIRTRYGPQHPYLAYLWDDLANAHAQHRDHVAALQASDQAVGIITRAFPTDALEVALLRANRAVMLTALGRLGEAEADAQAAYDILRAHLGGQDPRTLGAARTLGILVTERGALADARQLFDDAVAGHAARDGSDAPTTASARLDLAGILLQLEEDAAAEASVQAALPFVTGDTELAATAQILLARIALRRSDLETAERQLEEAQTLSDPSDGAAAAQARFFLGQIQGLRGRSTEAETILRDALARYTRLVAADHPAVARTLHELAMVYADLGQADEAQRYFDRAIAVFTRSTGADSLSTAVTRTEKTLVLIDADRLDEAVAEADQALAIFRRLGDSVPLRRAFATNARGFALEAKGDLNAALSAVEQGTTLIGRRHDGARGWPGSGRTGGSALRPEPPARGPDHRAPDDGHSA